MLPRLPRSPTWPLWPSAPPQRIAGGTVTPAVPRSPSGHSMGLTCPSPTRLGGEHHTRHPGRMHEGIRHCSLKPGSRLYYFKHSSHHFYSLLFHLGYSAGEVIGRSWYSLLHPDDLSPCASKHKSLCKYYYLTTILQKETEQKQQCN